MAKSKVAKKKPLVPFWDDDLRALCLNGRVVKRYRQPAIAQVCILKSFQELGWRRRIDDPLPGNGGRLHAQQRLRETVRALNHALRPAGIRFECNGAGNGVLWCAA